MCNLLQKILCVLCLALLAGCSATTWPNDLAGTELEPINKPTHTQEKK